MGRMLGPGQTFAADHRESLMLAAIAAEKGVIDPAVLFESESFRASDAGFVQQNHIEYVIADYRMTTELPVDGSYFVDDPLAGYYSNPLPVAALNKFLSIPGVGQIFDDGVIVVYDLKGSQYYKNPSHG